MDVKGENIFEYILKKRNDKEKYMTVLMVINFWGYHQAKICKIIDRKLTIAIKKKCRFYQR